MSDPTSVIRSTIPSIESSVSIRPKINLEELRAQKDKTDIHTSPYFPLNELKSEVMNLLTNGVENGADHIRDPVGGSNADMFV